MIGPKEQDVLNLVIGLDGIRGNEDRTAERGRSVLQLIHEEGVDVGILLNKGGWTPQIAVLKGGGQYIDHPFVDGSELVAHTVSNVVETFTCLIKGASVTDMARYINELQRWANEARELTTEYDAIDPVYIQWKPWGRKIHQYARILDIEVAVKNPSPDRDALSREAVIRVTREPYWRIGVAPGDNPKKWTFIATDIYEEYDVFDVYLVNDRIVLPNQDPLVHAVVNNKMEHTWNQSNQQDKQNYLTIPAASIPGDAPALCALGIHFEGGTTEERRNRVFISRRTVPELNILLSDRVRDRLVHCAGDGQDAGSVTTVAYTTGFGVQSYDNTPAHYVADVTFPSGAYADDVILRWGVGSAPPGKSFLNSSSNYYMRVNAMRGKFAIYVRCELTSGISNEIDLYARIGENANIGTFPVVDYVDSTEIGNPVAVSTADRYNLLWLGTIDVPYGVNPRVDMQGKLMDVGLLGQFYLELRHKDRSSGSAATLRVVDIILVPYSEPNLVVYCPTDPTVSVGSGRSQYLLVDNTGYLTRGVARTQAIFDQATSADGSNSIGIMPAEVRGHDITLRPGVDNKLHFLNTHNIRLTASTWEEVSHPDDFTDAGGLNQDMIVAVNIVPRCTYIADVEV